MKTILIIYLAIMAYLAFGIYQMSEQIQENLIFNNR